MPGSRGTRLCQPSRAPELTANRTGRDLSKYQSSLIGSERTRFPVAAKIALHTAGAIGGVPGSPTPPRCSMPESTMCTSMIALIGSDQRNVLIHQVMRVT